MKQERLAALVKFSTDELEYEISVRKAEEKEAAKDRTARIFYRQLSGSFKTFQEKAKATAVLTAEQQIVIREHDDKLYYLDQETPEEIALRLSRYANARENYDQCTATYYDLRGEFGFQNTGMLSEARRNADLWVNDKEWWYSDDGGYENCLLGRSAWTPEYGECFGYARKYK